MKSKIETLRTIIERDQKAVELARAALGPNADYKKVITLAEKLKRFVSTPQELTSAILT